jgi:UDP-N-acetylglucosamine--N-acetylmuramyl-(pentapeptide) pyrophosphoryl-undecaprenol N-acetylglucosamine transferase
VRVLIAGGGTAGHVFPAIAVARVLSRDHGVEVAFAGTSRGLESSLVLAAGFPLIELAARPFSRHLSADALRAVVSLVGETRLCRSLVSGFDAVLGVGGYVSAPPVAAAMLARTPYVLHEQNAVPGAANRLFARTARVVATSFPQAQARFARARTVVTGDPVREEIATVMERRESLRDEAYSSLELDRGRATMVVFGGSQGAARINDAALGAVELLRNRSDLQIVLLTGPDHLSSSTSSLAHALGAHPRLLVRPVGFLDRMELAYAMADLVVSRAGATSIAEITATGCPALLVPYPHATKRHQDANAACVADAGAAQVIADADLTPSVLASRIDALLEDAPGLAAMSAASRALARPFAAEALASIVVEEASRR